MHNQKQNDATITFGEVSTQFRGLVERRRKHLTFLFSTAAAFSILADGVFHGRLPRPLAPASSAIVIAGVFALMLLSFVTAIREARLHKGLVFNGRLWEALNTSAPKEVVAGRSRPWKFNPFGVSTSLFAVALIGGVGLSKVSCEIFGVPSWLTVVLLSLTTGGLIIYFVRQHQSGGKLAKDRTQGAELKAHDQDAWRSHVSASIDDAHQDMLELLAMAGLVTFFGFQLLTGLGEVRIVDLGFLEFKQIEQSGPTFMSSYMILVTAITMSSYLRLRTAVGHLSLQLDPTDRPFGALTLDDSFFGFLILLALISFDLFLLLASVAPGWSGNFRGIVTSVTAGVMLISERLLMVMIGRKHTEAPKKPRRRKAK